MRRIYLDHNATTPLHPAVMGEMLPYFRDGFGNPSSIHREGQEARRAVDRARQQVADLVGAEPSEIVFVSGGTEADNYAIRGATTQIAEGAQHIITTSIEHPAVLETCKYLERRGYRVTYLPVDEWGLVDPGTAADAITPNTALTTIMLANNDVGTIQPVGEIAEIARAKGVPIHTDAVQALGKIPVDVRDLGVDLLSISGHKIHGPKGIGALYIRKGMKLASLLYGGHHERSRRAGTENVPGIVGLGKACEIAGQELKQTSARMAALRDRLQDNILERISNVQVNGHTERRLPNTLNMSFSFVEGESLLMNLDLIGIAVSTGSACTSGTLEPSHVLIAMGRSAEQAHGSIRFSLGRENTDEDMDRAVGALVEVVGKLRKMSPLYADFKAKSQSAGGLAE